MNKQSNTYTVIYITIVVAVVGLALAFTAMSLRPRQQENEQADKMKQILSAIHITPESGQTVTGLYDQYVSGLMQVDSQGNVVAQGDATDKAIFDINVTKEAKEPADKRLLPVYVCATKDGTKYVLPVAGNGLWGPIWGYVAVDADGSTVYGAYFSHQGETPGLGAEIEKPEFSDRFIGKQLVKDGTFLPIAVVKAGQHPADARDYIDGVSGGTITSKGVGAMIDNCLSPYAAWLKTLGNQSAKQ